MPDIFQFRGFGDCFSSTLVISNRFLFYFAKFFTPKNSRSTAYVRRLMLILDVVSGPRQHAAILEHAAPPE